MDIKKIIKYIFITSVKDWLFLGLLTALLGTFVLSSLLGYSSLVEENTMNMVIFSGISRLILVCGIVIFICFYINRSFENKEIPFILSKNISREKFIVCYYLSFNLIIQLLLLLVVLLIILFCNPNGLGLLQWYLTMVFELSIMVCFALAVSFIVKSFIFSVFSCVGFYVISRMMNFFVNALIYSGDTVIMAGITKYSQKLLGIICNLIPRLDLFSQTRWLVYGAEWKIFTIIVLQTIIYVPILLFVVFYDFRKKQF